MNKKLTVLKLSVCLSLICGLNGCFYNDEHYQRTEHYPQHIQNGTRHEHDQSKAYLIENDKRTHRMHRQEQGEHNAPVSKHIHMNSKDNTASNMVTGPKRTAAPKLPVIE